MQPLDSKYIEAWLQGAMNRIKEAKTTISSETRTKSLKEAHRFVLLAERDLDTLIKS